MEKLETNDCPFSYFIDLIRGKWILDIILLLKENDKMRFSDISFYLSGISEKVLAEKLRFLGEKKILEKTIYPTTPPKVEYELSKHGRELSKVLDNINNWVSFLKTNKEVGINNSKSL